MKSRYKLSLVVVGLLLVIGLVTGISYAYWQITLKQESNNTVMSDCFKIEFSEGDAITLNKAFPMSDIQGKDLTPYTFTITNVCSDLVEYQINLESLNQEESVKALPDRYLKVNLSEGEVSKKTTKLDKTINSSLDTEITIENAKDAYKLVTGRLAKGEAKTFDLRIWMHSDVGVVEDSMNASWLGRVSIITSYKEDTGTMMAYDESYAFWQDEYAGNITEIVIEPKIAPKETELAWDISLKKDGSVMSYLMPNEGDSTKYTLYIQGNGEVIAPENSSNLFHIYVLEQVDWTVFELFTSLTRILGLEYLNTSNVTNMSSMFLNCNNLTSIDLSHFDTSNVTDMSSMFSNCNSLTSIDVSQFDTSHVTNMSSMFSGYSGSVPLDLSHFDTSNVTNMSSMFNGCSSLISLDVSHFNTSNVTDMSWMFESCSSLTSLDLSHFDTSNVTNMDYMFSYCSSLINLDLSIFDTSNVTNMKDMFSYCRSLTSIDLNHFNTNNVTDMSWMFYGCSSLTNLDLSRFDINNIILTQNMFTSMPNEAKIYVKDESVQNWVLTSDNGRPSMWTVDNVIIKNA